MAPGKRDSTWSRASVIAMSIASFSIGVATTDIVQTSISGSISFASHALSAISPASLPAQAQIFAPDKLAALPTVAPPSEYNGTSIFVPPGMTFASLEEKPFHIYDEQFLRILGSNPTLTLIAETAKDPLFHEAVVWYPEGDEAFFVQNAGAPDAGTGLNKSAIVQKISLAEAKAVSSMRNATGKVKVHTVDTQPQVLNPNGKLIRK